MKKKLSIRFYCLVICLMYGRKVTGSELDLTYTTEVQTNFRKEGKWVNLLRLDYSCPLGRNFRFSFSSISIAETRQDALVDDMQGFSNIEEKNLPFAPAVLGLSSVNYRKNDSEYSMGAGIHRGMCVGDETGVEEAGTSPQQKRMTCVLWACVEQRVCKRGYALLQCSVRPSVEGGCRSYAGAGGVVKCDKVSFGFFLDYADYTTAHEWAGEVTCRWACTSRMTVQPAIHIIRNSNGNYAAGLLRMYYVW